MNMLNRQTERIVKVCATKLSFITNTGFKEKVEKKEEESTTFEQQLVTKDATTLVQKREPHWVQT